MAVATNTKGQWTLAREREQAGTVAVMPIVTYLERGQASEMMDCPAIAVVDDDESVRESLPDLLREFGFSAKSFSSAQEFLGSGCVDQVACLILDVAMPGMNGLELQRKLRDQGQRVPIIFITARNDGSVRTSALALGAVEFLYKPFSDAALLQAINFALECN